MIFALNVRVSIDPDAVTLAHGITDETEIARIVVSEHGGRCPQ